MNYQNFKSFIFFFAIIVVLISCSKDEEFFELEQSRPLPTSETIELIMDWNALWLELDRYTVGMRPNSAARALGYIHLAGYETAVGDIFGFESNIQLLSGLHIDQSQRAGQIHLGLALNTAYALVFDHFMFNLSNDKKSEIATLQSQKRNSLSQGLSAIEVEDSEAWGTYVAQSVIAFSQSDSEAETQILNPTPTTYVPPIGEGLWTYIEGEELAWFPYWGKVRTFQVSPADVSSSPPTNRYSERRNSGYYQQMQEVDSISRIARLDDNEDLWIAEFWSDDVEGLMMSPPGRQFSIAQQLIEQFNLDTDETLVLLLKLGFAMNDSAVSAWKFKYEYNTERPNRFIEQFINPNFETNLARLVTLPNPSFPSYPSGHAVFAGAAAGIFEHHFRRNSIDFTDRTHANRTVFRGMPRQYNSFREMAEENAYSRIALGVHIRADSDEGLHIGYQIADEINEMDLEF